MFMVGACYEGSGIKLSDTLNSPTFVPHPATGDILDWFVRHGADPAMKSAAHTARQLFQTWLSKKENQEKLRQQQMQFGFDEEGEEAMGQPLSDDIWTRRGITLLWDDETLSGFCPADRVISLRRF